MPTSASRRQLISEGFLRVERDDRLVDIFPTETAEKGVELWERWSADSVEVVRIHHHKQSLHTFTREVIEQALRANTTLSL